ncbi:hypothetical protein TNCV_2952341 [Trichonephila clavipes]|nr:hypothetical protein TNCV_2952341 [Trichonephila clavipes]
MADRMKFALAPTTAPAHCQAKLQWYLDRSGWNHADRECTVFSDESCFQLCLDNHRRCPGQHADLAFTIARHNVAMNCLTACQTFPWPNRSLSDQACLGFDGKATTATREC